MKNFQINNSTIDIIGDIGESWFEEGITMSSVKEQLSGLEDDLNINVSSLGGNVNDGLVIHDLIKSYKGKTTAKIVGFTASAGTIVALGADTVEISENALFLIHNAWTCVCGNQHDMREYAEEMNIIDSVLVSIYQKKTGKKRSQIETLMKEERWLNAEEAKEWGFVDKINKAENAISNKLVTKINNSLILPKMEKNDKSFMDKLFAFFNVDKAEDVISKAEDSIKEVDSLKEDLSNSAEKIETLSKEKAELEENITCAKNSIEELKAEKEKEIKELSESKEAEVKELKAKIAELEASKTIVNQIADPDVNDGSKASKIGKELTGLISNQVKRQMKKSN